MKSSDLIINTLKETLRANAITYAQLGQALSLSEASIKRIFSNKTFDLTRIEEICNYLNISIFELMEMAKHYAVTEYHLYTLKQEQFFAKNPKYLALFDMLLNGKTLSHIKKSFNLTLKESSKYLSKLEELKLIEVHPQDKIKISVSKNIKWRENGPLRQLFYKNAKLEFINEKFHSPQDFEKLAILSLCEKSRKKLEVDLDDLYKKYEKVSYMEQKLKVKTKQVGLLMASRKWNFSLLETLGAK